MYCTTSKIDAFKCAGAGPRLLGHTNKEPGVEAPNIFERLLKLNFQNANGEHDAIAYARAPVWEHVIIDSLHTTLRVVGHLIQAMSKFICSLREFRA